MNSKPWENEELRHEYILKNDFDEAHRYLCLALPAERLKKEWSRLWGAFVPNTNKLIPASDPHHIFQAKSGSGKWDLWSNLLSISRPTHLWFHAHPKEAKIICLKAKFDKRLIDRKLGDFDLTELALASGYVFPSYLSTLDDCGNAVLGEWKAEMVDYFRQ